MEGESVQDEEFNKGLPLHEESLGHHHVELALLPHKLPVAEDLLLGNVNPVPDHGKVHLDTGQM